MKKVVREGKVAVLYSPGFGAGWSTWGGGPEAIFSPEIVALVEAGASYEEIGDAAKRLFGEHFYCGGATDLSIRWLDEGTQFRIKEYDGAESVVVNDDDYWTVA
jgi:hypothetical protein